MPSPSDSIIVDADGLIAVFDISDLHFPNAIAILKRIDDVGATLVYPATTTAEAIATFQRKLRNQTAVTHIIKRLKAKEFVIEPVDAAVIDTAVTLFHPDGSKNDTLFDAIVAAIAQKKRAAAIFSFDAWYQKAGFTLASDLLPDTPILYSRTVSSKP
jgi:predicted nucleic acid-binding protein